MSTKRTSVGILFCIAIFVCLSLTAKADLATRQKYLERLQSFLPPEKLYRGNVTPLDASWQDWLDRTGELPPDFNELPSLPFLPDPLILDEGGANIPVKTTAQWQQKRKWIETQVKHWITGTFPPAPENLKAKILSETKDGDLTIKMVQLSFGPDSRAKLTLELIIPPGKKPMPVFMTQHSHRLWALIAVRRGYIGCAYAGSDSKDDTEDYAEIWHPQYDFTRLMRRAWGASRAVDYLYTLDIVDKDRIALTGHSRNGKLSLMAAAFDKRITAVIPSSGGTGAENPWRFTSEKYDTESITEISTVFPYWIHPRIRFFVGAEHKLPVDQNLLMALVAPRGLILSSALTEGQGCPLGIEQAYFSAKKVYDFLGAEDKLAIRFRPGKHATSARDIEDYVDFFDYAFGRTSIKPANKLYCDYSFNKWLSLSGEYIDPLSYPAKGLDDLLTNNLGNKITNIPAWMKRKEKIKARIRWALGDEPPGATNPGPKTLDNVYYSGDDYLGKVIGRMPARKNIGRMPIAGWCGFGEYLYGNLYYPTDDAGKAISNNLPVVIYLHEYAYATGFARRSEEIITGFVEQGIAVFVYDQIGFGTRLDDGTFFYQRYPHWSKMGKMIADVSAAVDTMQNMEIIDKNRIYAAGYSLGATVALYSAALDERIKAVVSVCGFTPMRLDTMEKGTEGIKMYSHLHGLIPRLGFFIGRENHIPYDFHEVIAAIAPRPALIVAPIWDRFAAFDDIKQCLTEVEKVYDLLGAENKIELCAPRDYNRFTPETLGKVLDWSQENFK